MNPKPAAVFAAEYLSCLGFFDALDVSDPDELIMVFSDVGMKLRDRTFALLRMAMECPDVGEAMMNILDPDRNFPMSQEARIRYAKLMTLHATVQKADTQKEAKPEAKQGDLFPGA
jgi:hypothetical protein